MLNGSCQLPDFLIIGAAKSGTTSFFHYLGQHPAIYFPPENKEPGFLCFAGHASLRPDNGLPDLWATAVTDLNRYTELFRRAPEGSLVGEATPEYLLLPEQTITTIDQLYGERAETLKFVALLRNPVERIWSHYMMMQRDGFEKLEFEQAIASETISSRLKSGWHPAYDYLGYGRYGEQVSAYLERFGASQVKLVLYEDFRADPERVCRDVYDFLGLNITFSPDVSVRYNVSGVLRHPWLHRLLFTREHHIKSMVRRVLPSAVLQRLKARVVGWNCRPVAMPPEMRSRLAGYYREDIQLLVRVTGLDLAGWLTEP